MLDARYIIVNTTDHERNATEAVSIDSESTSDADRDSSTHVGSNTERDMQ